MEGGTRTQSHDSVLPVTLDEMWPPLTGVDENEEINREGDHLLKAEIQFVKRNRVDVVIADAEVGAGGKRRWGREGVKEGAKSDKRSGRWMRGGH